MANTPRPKRCLILIHGLKPPKWLEGEWLDDRNAVVTSDDPIWKGAVIKKGMGIIKSVRDNDGRT